MTFEFTEKDRKFIIKLATECDSLKKRVKALEDEQKASKIEAKQDAALSKTVGKTTKVNTLKVFNKDSSINVQYGVNPPTLSDQRALAEALYKSLYELCDDNGITSLTVVIKPEQMI